MELNEQQAEKINQFCLEFYKQLDFAHNVGHMNTTLRLAEYIGEREGADLGIVRFGAKVHQFHDNIYELQEFLKKIDVESNTSKRLIECAQFRPFKKNLEKQASIEAKVVFDANALQVLGPYGIIREITCNVEARKKSLNQSVLDAKEIEEMFYNSLQTKTAKEMIEKPHKLMREFWKSYNEFLEVYG